MADSAKRLPISKTATRDQIICVRHWHRQFIANLMSFAEGKRDEKGIKRSMGVIQDCNAILEANHSKFELNGA